jgi:hypothetical protein
VLNWKTTSGSRPWCKVAALLSRYPYHAVGRGVAQTDEVPYAKQPEAATQGRGEHREGLVPWDQFYATVVPGLSVPPNLGVTGLQHVAYPVGVGSVQTPTKSWSGVPNPSTGVVVRPVRRPCG